MPAFITSLHGACSPQVHYLLTDQILQQQHTDPSPMATMVGAGLSFGLSSPPPPKALKNSTLGGSSATFNHSTRRLVVVRAEGGAINPEIRKTEEKVVDAVIVTELAKPVTAYCRCWRSGTFPLCDGGHVKHNKATGDNVGPLVLKKQ